MRRDERIVHILVPLNQHPFDLYHTQVAGMYVQVQLPSPLFCFLCFSLPILMYPCKVYPVLYSYHKNKGAAPFICTSQIKGNFLRELIRVMMKKPPAVLVRFPPPIMIPMYRPLLKIWPPPSPRHLKIAPKVLPIATLAQFKNYTYATSVGMQACGDVMIGQHGRSVHKVIPHICGANFSSSFIIIT